MRQTRESIVLQLFLLVPSKYECRPLVGHSWHARVSTYDGSKRMRRQPHAAERCLSMLSISLEDRAA